MDDNLKGLSYKRLSSILNSSKELKKPVAQEIRRRRREKELPDIKSLKTYELSDNQQHLFSLLVQALTGDPDVLKTDGVDIMSVSYRVKGGWVVYVTGSDPERTTHKVSLIKEMVKEDSEEFGLCRVCVSAVRRNNWDGLLVRFDRGLRLVYE